MPAYPGCPGKEAVKWVSGQCCIFAMLLIVHDTTCYVWHFGIHMSYIISFEEHLKSVVVGCPGKKAVKRM